MRVVAVYSVKGGVGKTTTAVNLAFAAAGTGSTLLWDLDPQGGATYLLQVRPKLRGGASALLAGDAKVHGVVRQTAWEPLHVIPGDASYRDLDLLLDAQKKSSRRVDLVLDELAADYDWTILDCPPGSSLLARNVLRAADLVVVPLIPSALALRSLDQVVELVVEEDKPPKVVGFLTQVDRRRAAHRAAVDSLPAQRGVVLDVVVPAASVVEKMGERRQPLAAFAERTPAADAYAQLWDQVAGELHGKR